jgi:hypothetical protein
VVSAQTRAAIESLTADYWRRVDRQSNEPADALYVEAGRMRIGTLQCEGREAISRFFVERTEREAAAARTTRHLTSGLHIEAIDAHRCRVFSVVSVLAGTGGWPMASAPAATVGDFEDVVVETAPGVWRFESREARIVFVGSGAAAFARPSAD